MPTRDDWSMTELGKRPGMGLGDTIAVTLAPSRTLSSRTSGGVVPPHPSAVTEGRIACSVVRGSGFDRPPPLTSA